MKNNNVGVQFIVISIKNVGQRIDNFLRTFLKKVPKSLIYRIIRKGEIRINKKKVKPEYKLKNTDEIRIPPIYSQKTKQYVPLNLLNKNKFFDNFIIYEDDYLLAINKPTGTAVHGGSGLNFGIIELLRILKPNIHTLELVHRLDKDTSGIVIIAKKRSTLVMLHEQLRDKKMQKHYLALVYGQWQSHIKVISLPLIKKNSFKGDRIVQVNSQGKLSETHFKIEEQFKVATLVSAIPITGRTHQIRVHAQYVGHPIALDNKYGHNNFNKLLKKCGLNRLFLHSASLGFKHPNNGQLLTLNAPLDNTLKKCLQYLRTYYK